MGWIRKGIMLNGLSLFSGIGGIDVALSDYVRPIAYCEIDPYCQGVLLSRMESSDISRAPIWDDIRSFDGSIWESYTDIIYGGFPCQDISIAGHGKGLEGERSGLFFEMLRLAKEIKPKFLFFENVPPITQRGGIQIINEIAEMGYDCRWCVISAASVAALHHRERWFLLAYSQSERCQKTGQSFRSQTSKSKPIDKIEYGSWNEESKDKFELVRMANGIQDRSHRIRALGNAVVPDQAKEAFEILMGLK